MYVVVQHLFKNPKVAFERGEKLAKNEGAPSGLRALEFYPSQDGSRATCLYEANAVEDVQKWVDETLGDAAENLAYPVNPDQAFAERPSISQPPSRR